MPELDILDKTPEDVVAEIMEKIMFPEDEYFSDCYHYIGIAKKHIDDDLFWSYLDDPVTGEIRKRYTRSIMNKILQCPSASDMKKIQEKAFKESFVAGCMLMNLYKLHILGEAASIGNAAYATRVQMEKLNGKLPVSDIEKKWKKYHKSAHFMAALILYINSLEKLNSSFVDDLGVLLSTANEYYKFGKIFKPPKKTNAIFDGDMWTIPEKYLLPEVGLPTGTSDTTIIDAVRVYLEGKKWLENW